MCAKDSKAAQGNKVVLLGPLTARLIVLLSHGEMTAKDSELMGRYMDLNYT